MQAMQAMQAFEPDIQKKIIKSQKKRKDPNTVCMRKTRKVKVPEGYRSGLWLHPGTAKYHSGTTRKRVPAGAKDKSNQKVPVYPLPSFCHITPLLVPVLSTFGYLISRYHLHSSYAPLNHTIPSAPTTDINTTPLFPLCIRTSAIIISPRLLLSLLSDACTQAKPLTVALLSQTAFEISLHSGQL